MVSDLKLANDNVTVRLTGPVQISDEEFGTLKEGAALNGALTVLAVLVILWLALHSARIMLAVFVSLFVGLAATAALGLLMVAPYVDKNPSHKPTDRKFAICVFTVFLMFWSVLVIIGSFFRGQGFNFTFPWNDHVFFEL